MKSIWFKWNNWNGKYISRWFLSNKIFTFYFQFYNFKEKKLKLSDIELISITVLLFISSRRIFADDLKIIWNLLSSRRIRFNLTDINLKMNLLSECLTVLSLCAKCPELKSVSLKFIGWDEDDEKEAINSAIKKFKRNFRFIKFIKIYQS